MFNHPWWHWFFVSTISEEKEVTRGNWVGSKPRIDRWVRFERCSLCKVTKEIDLMIETQDEQE